ncbi:MAG: hypothetical protein CML12_03310 [Puniceicoccaceae bacterium]|nr:hypothetical protein [Puniceicoccaceae bacterium]RCL30036.1 MAG: hypothetical protein DBX03_02990 [Puniceicoccaceae bacterium]
MQSIYTILIACALALVASSCQSTSTGIYSPAYSPPSPSPEASVDTVAEPVVQPLPTVLEAANETSADTEIEAATTRSDQSLSLENDRYRLTKTLIESDQVGGQIQYELHLDILKDIEQLWIEERLPENFVLLRSIPELVENNPTIWSFQNLKAGDTQTLALFLRPEKAGDFETQTRVRMEQSLALQLSPGQPQLELSLIAPDRIERNREGAWELSLSNRGTAVAQSVVLSARLNDAFEARSPVRYEIPQLDVGSSRSFSVRAKALKQGSFENQFSASCTHSTPETEGRAEALTQVVQSGIQIDVRSPAQAYVFKPETIDIQIQNTGDTDLEAVRITQLLSEQYSIIDTGGGRSNGSAIGWLIPELPAGNKQLIRTQVTAVRPGEASIDMRVRTAQGFESSDRTSTEWLAVPGVTVSILDAKDPLTVGETTEFTIRVRNQGEFEPVKGTIELTFSDELRPLAILSEIEGTLTENRIRIPEVQLYPERDLELKISAQALKAGSARTYLNFMADFLNQPLINQESTTIY